MATFRYQTLDAEDQPVAGEVQAESVQQAVAELEARGLRVQSIGYATSVSPSGTTAVDRSRAEATSVERAVLRSHLKRVLEGGATIAPALRAYAEEVRRGRRRRELQMLSGVLERGDVAEAERIFAALPEYWIPLLSAATSSHDPGRVLHKFLEESQRADELRRQWGRTLVYPLLVASLAVAVLTALSVLIVPGFRDIFQEFDLQVPAFTRLVLALSWWINQVWIVVVLVLLAAIVALALYVRGSLPLPTRGWLGDRFRAPFGRATAIARFAQFTADLLEAGLTTPDALRVAGISTYRWRLRKAAWRLADELESGTCGMVPIHRRSLTVAVLYALRSEIPAASRVRLLREISQSHAERARVRLSWTRGIVEPIAIVVVGIVVGAVVIALFLPLVRLIDGLAT